MILYKIGLKLIPLITQHYIKENDLRNRSAQRLCVIQIKSLNCSSNGETALMREDFTWQANECGVVTLASCSQERDLLLRPPPHLHGCQHPFIVRKKDRLVEGRFGAHCSRWHRPGDSRALLTLTTEKMRHRGRFSICIKIWFQDSRTHESTHRENWTYKNPRSNHRRTIYATGVKSAYTYAKR